MSTRGYQKGVQARERMPGRASAVQHTQMVQAVS